MIRFRCVAWGLAAAMVGACGDDGAVTTAGMTDSATGTTTTGTTTGTTGEVPTTGSPTTGGTGDETTGTTTTTGETTTTTTGVVTDTTMGAEACGDGVLDAGEDCDGAELGDQTCAGLGFDEGTLACLDSCEFDTSGCATCGDGTMHPELEECDDGNQTDGDGCDAACKVEACDPDGVYAIQGQPIAYTCCQGLVTVSISSFTLAANGALITSSPSNPVGMTGAETTCPDGEFDNSGMLAGGCTEVYSVSGTFQDANTWKGTYSLEFIGDDCSCFGGMFGTPCINQQFPVTATR